MTSISRNLRDRLKARVDALVKATTDARDTEAGLRRRLAALEERRAQLLGLENRPPELTAILSEISAIDCRLSNLRHEADRNRSELLEAQRLVTAHGRMEDARAALSKARAATAAARQRVDAARAKADAAMTAAERAVCAQGEADNAAVAFLIENPSAELPADLAVKRRGAADDATMRLAASDVAKFAVLDAERDLAGAELAERDARHAAAAATFDAAEAEHADALSDYLRSLAKARAAAELAGCSHPEPSLDTHELVPQAVAALAADLDGVEVA